MSRNLERERARRAWSQFVFERTHNGRNPPVDSGGLNTFRSGHNAVIIRPGKAKKKLLGGEPYGGNGRSVKKRLPNRPWRPPVQGAQDLRTVRRGGRS